MGPSTLQALRVVCSRGSATQQRRTVKTREGYENEPPLALNNLIRGESSNADLVLVNLPQHRGDMPASRLLQSLDAITERLARVVVFRTTCDP
ncbi:unnamed protein product [Gongylonema pulchrum]|uniref:AIG1-type G domain-containing protein n=1 Tax=Gongylonema pulchrum TaxID=637853 RepID=A0A183E389_9BILA|nr:unnamed protein product [Gongylonema pulchrum]